jgi:hypothetical protein
MAEDPDAEKQGDAPPLSPAARRALDEAEQRRAEAEKARLAQPKEVGRKGLDPARYGDWEKNGITSDF